jgi:hypothetical protein
MAALSLPNDGHQLIPDEQALDISIGSDAGSLERRCQVRKHREDDRSGRHRTLSKLADHLDA